MDETFTGLFKVIAKNVIAVSPLILKGREIYWAVKTGPSLSGGATLRLARPGYSIFESYNINCAYTGRINLDFARRLIFSALWILCASVFVEFLSWRTRRLRQSEEPRVENENIYECDITETTQEDENNPLSFTKPAVSALLFGSVFIIAAVVLHSLLYIPQIFHFWNGTYFPQRIPIRFYMGLSRFFVGGSYPVLFGYGVSSWRREITSESISPRLIGFVLGGLGGPVFLVLNALKIAPVSEKWTKIRESANIGLVHSALVPVLM